MKKKEEKNIAGTMLRCMEVSYCDWRLTGTESWSV